MSKAIPHFAINHGFMNHKNNYDADADANANANADANADANANANANANARYRHSYFGYGSSLRCQNFGRSSYRDLSESISRAFSNSTSLSGGILAIRIFCFTCAGFLCPSNGAVTLGVDLIICINLST
jgi:hypothetical protein